MEEYTFRDIKNMSDEEVAEVSRKMAGKVLTKLALFMLFKWTLIIAVNQATRRYIQRKGFRTKNNA